jgi:hypothetical protein
MIDKLCAAAILSLVLVGTAAAEDKPAPATPEVSAAPVFLDSPLLTAWWARIKACDAEVTKTGLKGQAAIDGAAICQLEVRLTCLKQAVDKKLVGLSRRDFMVSCMTP